ncbi:hypothetical protein BWI75_24965 [Gloeocapsopsis sp. AAB1 = 1H9]|uniref:Uncharacterized protein n=1 Tax=Gloeocapsopsis dulcis AAB1 = 1H9 TaxID=1433147 RepID=A0A6N8G3W9_9CHRO|nr:hypothetical protein [Gloeocapsopsis dulcis AAB1 = 1H9]
MNLLRLILIPGYLNLTYNILTVLELAAKVLGTTVVDKFRELGHACDSDGSELKLDEPCARKTNAG